MDLKLRDFELIEKAGLTNEIKFTTQATISALHYLKAISAELGIPIEQITAEHIIHEMVGMDSKIREQRRQFGL
jgi:hypothetical protein